MECNETRKLLPAYVDRELGVGEALGIDEHLARCAECRRERTALESIRALVRKQADYFMAPDGLEGRIVAALPSEDVRPARREPRRWHWLSLGGALATAAAVIWTVGLFLALPSGEDRLADEVVSSHVRSLLANRAVDVASSDRHTVKPWFDGKVDFAPPVHDLTAEGFPLAGGRVDYLDHRPVAALVYRHRQHVINVFVLPITNGAKDLPPKSLQRQGYNVLHWARGGMLFWAVSDTDAEALQALSQALAAQQ